MVPTPDPHILSTFPSPVAYPYRLVFDEHEPPSKRRWTLCTTVNQLLRMVGLPLVCQYLRAPIDLKKQESVSALNRAIMALRSPTFSDWLSLVGTMRRHLSQVDIKPLFPELGASLDGLASQVGRRRFSIAGKFDLPPLEAIWALRNFLAHREEVQDEAIAAQHLAEYLDTFREILAAFHWLAEYELIIAGRAYNRETSLPVQSCLLRGVTPSAYAHDRLSPTLAAALQECPALLRTPDQCILPLFPFFHPFIEPGPIHLYDGHIAIKVESTQQSDRSGIYYFGVDQPVADVRAIEELRSLLSARQISFDLPKEHTAPWTIADSAEDYSRRTVNDLTGTKYIPDCYVPFTEIETHLQRFLAAPKLSHWPSEALHPRYVNGLILTGPAGAGKTALLTRLVETLLADPSVHFDRENPNLVVFLRGDNINMWPEGSSLFREVAEKLGIALDGALHEYGKRHHRGHGFSSFRELLSHLHSTWKDDRVPRRRMIVVLDALNEAPNAELIVREALALVKEAARYRWLKIIVSLRQEWLSVSFGKLGTQEQSPLEDIRAYLYAPDTQSGNATLRVPSVTLEPFSEEQARVVYERYQAGANTMDSDTEVFHMRACLSLWSEIPLATRQLFRNPLYLHLFVGAFAGRRADAMSTPAALFRRYVEYTLQRRPGLEPAVATVVTHLLKDAQRTSANLSEDDVAAIRHEWARPLSPSEARQSFNPIEALAHEGLLRKRMRDDGGGYRFVFQTVAEYLLYRDMVEQRSPEEDHLVYWQRKAHAATFPEYTGAFTFVLREWLAQQEYTRIAQFVESAPDWMGHGLTTVLFEQARGNDRREKHNDSIAMMVDSLCERGGERCLEAVLNTGMQLVHTRFAPTARIFLESGITLAQRLSTLEPTRYSLVYLLAVACRWLGNQLISTGQLAAAESRLHTAVDLFKSLSLSHRENLTFGVDFAGALADHATLLSTVGDVEQSVHAYEEALALYEVLRKVHPDIAAIDKQRGWTLSSFGVSLAGMGRFADAEQCHRQAIAILQPLWTARPGEHELGLALSRALSNLGTVLDDSERPAEAKRYYEQAVMILETLLDNSPDEVSVCHTLAGVLLNLGGTLDVAGQKAEAEHAYKRCLALCEHLQHDQTWRVEISLTVGRVLMNLGLLSAGRTQEREAEQYYQRATSVFRSLWTANPQCLEAGQGLADTLTNIGKVLWETGRWEQAMQAAREAVELYDTLWRTNPQNGPIADALDTALHNLLTALVKTGQFRAEDDITPRIFALRQARWRAKPNDIELTVQYAVVLCRAEKVTEAAPLLDSVLAQVPNHPYANELRQMITRALLDNPNLGH